MTTTISSGDTRAPELSPGWLGAPPCRDLALGVAATFALRAIAAHVDPLASSLEQRLNVVLAATMLVTLVGCAAYAATGRRSSRPLVAPDRVPAWARPGAALTAVLAVLAIGSSCLSVLALFDASQTLIDHVSSAGTAIYLGLGLRLQWAAATGRMTTAVPVVEPSSRTKLIVRAAFVATTLAVGATAVAAPFVISRDRRAARCANNDLVHSEAQTAIATLDGDALQQRIEELARDLGACG